MAKVRRAALGIAGILSLLLLVASAQAGDPSSSRRSGGRAVAHQDGRPVSAGSVPTAVTYSVGGHALEPTLGVDPKGRIFYAAAGFDSIRNLPGTQIMRSADGGKTWKNTSPRILGYNSMPITLDPYIWVDQVDKKNARVFTIDLTLACSYLSFSDDAGESWVTNPLSCGRPVNDHQTLFGGPPAHTPMAAYPNVLYYCWNDVGSSQCSKSIDGGVTFHSTGTYAFSGYDTSGSQDPGFGGISGFCGGLHGHGAVGPDGTVYLPREYCGKPMLAVSKDEGITWQQIEVSKIRSTSQPTGGAGHPSVAVDEKGNVYYAWQAANNRLMYLSVSKNQGKSWSKPVQISAPGLTETNLPQIDATGVGKIAFVYYGSENSPFPKCQDECDSRDYQPATWNAYVTISANALDPNPTFYTGAVADPSDPLHRGRCGPGRCGWPYDFIDVEIGPDGIAYGAFVDGCMKGCTETKPDEGDYEGLVTKLVGGLRLK